MNYVRDIIDYIVRLFQWWITVSPWEQGLRIRFGNRVKMLQAGIHFKMPLFDQFYVQTTRLRIVAMPLQTLTSKDNQSLTIMVSLAYSIRDIRTLYQSIYRPEGTITSLVMGAVADHVAANDINDLMPSTLTQAINESLSSAPDYGIKYEGVKIIGYARVKTYRFINDSHYMDGGYTLDNPVNPGAPR